MNLCRSMLKKRIAPLFLSSMLFAMSSAQAMEPFAVEFPENGNGHIAITHYQVPATGNEVDGRWDTLCSMTIDSPFMALAGLSPLHFRSGGEYHPGETVGRFLRMGLETVEYNAAGNMGISIFYEFTRNGVQVEDNLACIIPERYTDLYTVTTTDNPRELRFNPRETGAHQPLGNENVSRNEGYEEEKSE